MGHVQVYQYDEDEDLCIQLGQDLNGKKAEDRHGYAVDLSEDGMILAVGGEFRSIHHEVMLLRHI